MTTSGKLRAACIQLCSGIKVEANVAAAAVYIRQAVAEGATFIATPEMTSLLDRAPGAVMAKARIEAEDEALASFRALARELKIHLLVGSLPIRLEREGGSRCVNRSLLIGPEGEVRVRYDKIHMFDVELGPGNAYRESATFAAGDRAVVAGLPGAALGLSICYDVRFPHLFRDLARAGAEILTVPAAFTRVTGEAHWHLLLRARAVETGCFVVAPAQGGRHEDGRETYGHSLIIGPWGDIIAELDHAEPGILLADLDLNQVAEARGRIPALGHDRPYAIEIPDLKI